MVVVSLAPVGWGRAASPPSSGRPGRLYDGNAFRPAKSQQPVVERFATILS